MRATHLKKVGTHFPEKNQLKTFDSHWPNKNPTFLLSHPCSLSLLDVLFFHFTHLCSGPEGTQCWSDAFLPVAPPAM